MIVDTSPVFARRFRVDSWRRATHEYHRVVADIVLSGSTSASIRMFPFRLLRVKVFLRRQVGVQGLYMIRIGRTTWVGV